jgi:hypothetical protein
MDKRVWLSPRALRLHAVILVVVPGFTALCVWQIYRAVGGNELSWAYVFEWPFFAAYAIYMWWRFVHEPREVPAVAAPAVADSALGGQAAVAGDASRHAERDDAGAGGSVAATDAGADGGAEGDNREDQQDAELAAYNAYLAQLAARDRAVGR